MNPTQTIPRDIEEPSIISPSLFPPENDSDRLFQLVRLVWQYRRFLMRFSALIAIVVLVIGLLTPNSYRSTTQLMPPDNRGGSGLAAMASMASRMEGGGGGLGLIAGDLLGLQSTGELFIAVLHSRTAEDSLVDKFDLTAVYGHPWLHWRISQEDARKELEDNTEVEEDRKSGVISISVTDTDRGRSAQITRAYVDELNQLIASLSTSSARREREFLEQRLAQVKKNMDNATHQLSEFSSKNAAFDPKDQGRAMVEATSALQGQLIAFQSQLQGLEAIYSDNNVRIRSLRARIAELKKQLGNISGTNLGANASSENDSEMPLPSIRQLPLLGATYADLYLQAKIQETVYEVLTQQYEMAKVEEAKEIPTVRVLDIANLPEKKWKPHRVLNALLGGTVGFFFGCILIIFRSEWDRRSSHHPYKVFIREVLAAVENFRIVRWLRELIMRHPTLPVDSNL